MVGQNGGTPQYFIQFTQPKTYYTQSELIELERLGQLLPAPVFGRRIGVPTPTTSANGTFEQGGATTVVQGDRLGSTSPSGDPDYRGYVDLQTWDHDDDDIPIPGVRVKFKYTGLSISEIPVDQTKFGTNLGYELITVGTQDTPPDIQTIYVRINSGPAAKRGVTKYDVDRNVIWRIGQAPDEPDTIKYDPTTERIALTYLSLPDEDVAGTMYYNFDGELVQTVRLPEEFGAEECSRNGKIYGYSGGDVDVWPSVQGYSPAGNLLWTIPGEPTDGGWHLNTIVAFGEDYIVVNIIKNTGLLAHEGTPGEAHHLETFGTYNGYRVYNAHTGAMVSETRTADNIQTDIEDSFPPSTTVITLNQESYGRLVGMFRSAYWP